MNIMERIAADAAKEFNVSLNAILSPRRARSVSKVRQIVMLVARNATNLSFPQIGQGLNRDHTTVLYGVRAAEIFIKGNVIMEGQVRKLEAKAMLHRTSKNTQLSQNWRMRRAA